LANLVAFADHGQGDGANFVVLNAWQCLRWIPGKLGKPRATKPEQDPDCTAAHDIGISRLQRLQAAVRPRIAQC
jgi:hypothetical protein